MKRLSNLGIKEKDCAPLGENESDKYSETSNSEEEKIDQLEKLFLSEQPEDQFQVNKLTSYKKKLVYNIPAKPYYHRPTPIDLQLEQRDEFNVVQFDGNSIAEWNIDGMIEYLKDTDVHAKQTNNRISTYTIR